MNSYLICAFIGQAFPECLIYVRLWEHKEKNEITTTSYFPGPPYPVRNKALQIVPTQIQI